MIVAEKDSILMQVVEVQRHVPKLSGPALQREGRVQAFRGEMPKAWVVSSGEGERDIITRRQVERVRRDEGGERPGRLALRDEVQQLRPPDQGAGADVGGRGLLFEPGED